MEEKNLSNSLIEGLENTSVDMIKDLGEVTLDSFMEDGIARDIPIVDSLCSLFKIGHTIRELSHLKRFYRFILGFVFASCCLSVSRNVPALFLPSTQQPVKNKLLK